MTALFNDLMTGPHAVRYNRSESEKEGGSNAEL